MVASTKISKRTFLKTSLALAGGLVLAQNAQASYKVKIYDTCIGCTQCINVCPTDVLEMVPWNGGSAGEIASAARAEDCVGCKRCENACPTDFLSIQISSGAESTRSLGLGY